MENYLHLVVFDLANEYYAVDIAAVEGIIKMQAITPVPHAPPFVEGVTNLRGKVLPVIDLRKRFGFTARETTNDTRIVVVEIAGATVGIVVDGVSKVLRINSESVEPASPMITTVEASFIKGIAKLTDRLVIVLDIGKVLSQTEQAVLRVVPAAAEPSE